MITREYLDERIAEFTAARNRCQSDLDANTGAIQVCKHLLNQLEAAEITEAAVAGDALRKAETEFKPNGGSTTPLDAGP